MDKDYRLNSRGWKTKSFASDKSSAPKSVLLVFLCEKGERMNLDKRLNGSCKPSIS